MKTPRAFLLAIAFNRISKPEDSATWNPESPAGSTTCNRSPAPLAGVTVFQGVLKCALVILVLAIPARTEEVDTGQVKEVPVPLLKLGFPGGVDTLVKADLMAMQKGSYILHVRGGKLTKVPAEKSILPANPGAWSHQHTWLAMADDGTVYVRQSAIMCKSTDGGRNWTSHPDPATSSSFQILKDGAFISVVASNGKGETDPAEVYRSRDEGRSWEKIAEIPIEVPGFDHKARYMTFPMYPIA